MPAHDQQSNQHRTHQHDNPYVESPSEGLGRRRRFAERPEVALMLQNPKWIFFIHPREITRCHKRMEAKAAKIPHRSTCPRDRSVIANPTETATHRMLLSGGGPNWQIAMV
jgi:hypothetical protein